MSTPAGHRAAQGLEAQLQKYKEAAVNLPRLVKKYKSLESQHAELRQQSASTATALDSSRKALSEAQSSNEALEHSLSNVKAERSALAASLEVSKRQNAILQNRIAGGQEQQATLQSSGEQPAAHPDTKLLNNALREVSALRAEVCSLVLAKRTEAEGVVLSELAAIRGQMSQLLQRCPKEDGFRASTTSRACTPVHESLASPPLQSMTSLYMRPGTVDVHRACAPPLVASCPQDAGKQSIAQPNSEASAVSSQAALARAASDATAHARVTSTHECVLNPSVEPPSPLQRAAQAPTVALPAAPSSTSSQCNASPDVTMRCNTAQVGGELGPCNHPIALPSVPHTSSLKRTVPMPAGSPAKRSVQDGSWSPHKRDRDDASVPPPRTCKTTQKKKHKASADNIAKGQEDKGFMKLQDVPSATQKRWKPPSQSEPQRKMMQFGSGTVKSTIVTGSCFSIRRKATSGSDNPQLEHTSVPASQLKDAPAEQQQVAEEGTAIEQHAAAVSQLTAAAHCDASMQQGTAAFPSKAVDQPLALNSIAAGKHTTDHSMREHTGPQDSQGTTLIPHQGSRIVDVLFCVPSCKRIVQSTEPPPLMSGPQRQNQPAIVCAGMQASLQVIGDEGASGAQQPVDAVVVEPIMDIRTASACKHDAKVSSECPSPAKAPEEFSQSLLNAAPTLLPSIMADCASRSGSSSSAPVECCTPRLCECTKQLCKQVSVAHTASDRSGSIAGVAADLAAHWEALDNSEQQEELAVELVSEIVQCVGAVAASVRESAVLSALTEFKEKQCGRGKLLRCGDAVGKVHEQFDQLLGTRKHTQFNATHCASILCQAQAQTSDSQPRICQAVAQELCRAVDSAVRGLEESCEEGEMADQASEWFTRLQLSALVGLLAAHERDASSVHASSTQYLMQMLTEADDLAGAIANVVGTICGDLGGGSVFGTCHENVVRFWDTREASSSDHLPVSPCALMLQVSLCATAAAAKECKGDSITALSGEIVWGLGQRLWGWCPAGADTMRSVCTGLMQMLESAGEDATSPVWSMFREHEQLTSALDTRRSCIAEPASQPAEAVGSETDSSSSEDSSDSDDGCEGDRLIDRSRSAADKPQGQTAVRAVLDDVQQALKFSARCCGWKWTAHTLLDSVVWPVFERLQKIDSAVAHDVHSVVGELIGDLLGLVQSLSHGDEAAAEYVITVQEALQFVS